MVRLCVMAKVISMDRIDSLVLFHFYFEISVSIILFTTPRFQIQIPLCEKDYLSLVACCYKLRALRQWTRI